MTGDDGLRWAHLRLLHVLDDEDWAAFARQYPLAAAQVQQNVERVAGQLQAVDSHVCGYRPWPADATELVVLDCLAGVRLPHRP